MPQFTQVTTLDGNGVPQRTQRCAGGPPNGGYTEDINDPSDNGNNSVGRVSLIMTCMSTSCQQSSIFGLYHVIT